MCTCLIAGRRASRSGYALLAANDVAAVLSMEGEHMLKVELEDAAAADETFTILMGDKVEPRREFIEKNAKYVQNLDV